MIRSTILAHLSIKKIASSPTQCDDKGNYEINFAQQGNSPNGQNAKVSEKSNGSIRDGRRKDNYGFFAALGGRQETGGKSLSAHRTNVQRQRLP